MKREKLVNFDNPEEPELNDNAILKLLKEMPEMYENGEIIEVCDICFDIYNAILDVANNK